MTYFHFFHRLFYFFSKSQKALWHQWVRKFFALFDVPVLAFVAIGVFSRLLPHWPNLTALNAIALFGAYSQRSLAKSLLAVLTTMLLSDFLIGFHSQMPFVYGALVLVCMMGRSMHSRRVWQRLPLFITSSSILFFLVTNFGVWLTYDFYPKSAYGLGLCLAAAIPFLSAQILGDLAYTLAFFWSARALKHLVQKHNLPHGGLLETPSQKS